MKTIQFQCTRCGKCCKEHKGPMLGQLHGLMLLPSEIELFPSEMIKPMFRYHPDTDPGIAGVIWMYQLDSDGCPHYSEELHGCKIYDKRPNTCRAFPFESRGDKIICHASCPEIERFKKLGVKLSIHRREIKAAAAMQEYQYQCMRREINVERFDLQTQTWRGILEGLSPEHWKWLRESA